MVWYVRDVNTCLRGSTLILSPPGSCRHDTCLQPGIQRLHYDDNGVTGPDWGLSEMVFGKSSGRTLAARR
jgi:hypothetical protein